MKSFSAWLWRWPDGLVWKLTRGVSERSRKKKFALFMELFKPTTETSILDVGVSGVASGERAENFLEEWYPHSERITALGIDDLSAFKARYPKVTVVESDGLRLPFPDQSFDIVFSNAVIEHVGNLEAQRAFVQECLRVGRAVFITTPARSFPLEAHTMVPFVHYFPDALRNRIYKFLGRVNEAKPDALGLLWTWRFRQLFPRASKVKIIRQRLVGLTSVLIAVTKKI